MKKAKKQTEKTIARAPAFVQIVIMTRPDPISSTPIRQLYALDKGGRVWTMMNDQGWSLVTNAKKLQ